MTVMVPIKYDTVDLAFDDAGTGTPVVLLHGLTATRRYVVSGSKALERSGHRVVAYDARGHGASPAAPPGEGYDYPTLAADLRALMDRLGIEHAVLAGASMGAHTLLRFALDHPDRALGLVVVTPAYDPDRFPSGLERWDALSAGLRTGGVEGFLAAYGEPNVPAAWRDTVATVLRQRISRAEDPAALADALSQVPRSRPFAAWSDLHALDLPVTVVGDRDDADPEHPLAVAQRYAAEIPEARFVVEEEGRSPIAWSGGQLSKVIAEVAAQ
jgi:pimeloyl-ACP methyl ester carboxylesterase